MTNNEMTLGRNNVRVSQRKTKTNIKNYMHSKNITVSILSHKTHINIYFLIFLLYFPFAKIKLTHAIKICKTLKISLSDIFD
jgi:DNA-binding Xre family transcriptional regulator